jgi:hypothetical protein
MEEKMGSPIGENRNYNGNFHPKTYDSTSPLKMLAVAVAVTAAIIGVGGLFVYMDKLSISWQGIGTISQEAALFGTAGCFTTTGVITIVLAVSSCISKSIRHSREMQSLEEQQA